MFRLGVPELVIIAIIVLFLFGGKKLHEMGKGIGEGIKIFKIADHSQSLLTTDLGGHFNPVTAIGASPKDSATKYASTTDGLYKSSNGGADWTRLSGELIGCVALSIDPQDPTIVYAASLG